MYKDLIIIILSIALGIAFCLYFQIKKTKNSENELHKKQIKELKEKEKNYLSEINQLKSEIKKLQEKEDNYVSERDQFKKQIEELQEKEQKIEQPSDEEFDEEFKQLFPIKKPEVELKNVHLPKDTYEEISVSISKIKKTPEIKEWILDSDSPLCNYISLEGSPGTGKTMLAEAIANEIGKDIIKTNYQVISDKFVGETEKRLGKLFDYAKKKDVVLFIDEAEPFLQSRIANAQSANDTHVNSTIGTILTLLNKYPGIVVFASNHSGNYDKAINSRVSKINVYVNQEVRYKIWYDQLKKFEGKLCDLPKVQDNYDKKFNKERNLLLKEGDTRSSYANYLARRYKELSGRDIKKIVENIAVKIVNSSKYEEDSYNNSPIHFRVFKKTCEEYIKNQKSSGNMLSPIVNPLKKGIGKSLDNRREKREKKQYLKQQHKERKQQEKLDKKNENQAKHNKLQDKKNQNQVKLPERTKKENVKQEKREIQKNKKRKETKKIEIIKG